MAQNITISPKTQTYNILKPLFLCFGHASFYDKDSMSDIVQPGAFHQYCKRNRNIPLLYEHKEQIGFVTTGIETTRGLCVQAIITKAIEPFVHNLSEKMILTHYFSIGFQVQDATVTQEGRILKEINLVEISLVRHPANKNAKIYFCEALGSHTRI